MELMSVGGGRLCKGDDDFLVCTLSKDIKEDVDGNGGSREDWRVIYLKVMPTRRINESS